MTPKDVKWFIKDFKEKNGRKPDKYELVDYMLVKELEGMEYLGLTPSSAQNSGFIHDGPFATDYRLPSSSTDDAGIFSSMNIAILAGVLALLGIVNYIRRSSG